ncbi:maleylpyruvate isomerase N-terminal domain-containing protein [Saxibacter everestensis]|uniref:Maleylpyruvate isomerase N-terminal domain-containing protein n=1 Tax=Saxibacter everestensis TaxID=2909229 RepID=A0ABY8QRL9_9MICO|nr:maleylpyruvate isomerase N-terminal domain-containing protein [Brevibacteriaceae bacterium ZFBP1038]
MSLGATEFRAGVDAVIPLLQQIEPAQWDEMAFRLTWTCRETVDHLSDDFAFYAMQLAGQTPPTNDYLRVIEPAAEREGGPANVMRTEPTAGTAGIVQTLDATAGLLAAVVAVTPADKRGYHPRGLADAGGFAAMGAIELVLHAHDILQTFDIPYSPAPTLTCGILDRLLPAASRTDDPWADLLEASGRGPSGPRPWTWDANVRD